MFPVRSHLVVRTDFVHTQYLGMCRNRFPFAFLFHRPKATPSPVRPQALWQNQSSVRLVFSLSCSSFFFWHSLFCCFFLLIFFTLWRFHNTLRFRKPPLPSFPWDPASWLVMWPRGRPNLAERVGGKPMKGMGLWASILRTFASFSSWPCVVLSAFSAGGFLFFFGPARCRAIRPINGARRRPTIR